MKKADAERQIAVAFKSWCRDQGIADATNNDALMFFGHISKERSGLLAFKASGDKWQWIKAFLSRAGLITGGL